MGRKKLKYFDIALVGGGLSATVFLYELSKNGYANSNIVIFDRKEKLGFGSFSKDLNSLLMNTPSEVLSICYEDPQHFRKWYESFIGTEMPRFVSRNIFGRYIKHNLDIALRKLRETNTVCIIESEVSCVDSENIVSYENQEIRAGKVINATGGVYSNQRRSPYPIEKVVASLSQLGAQCDVDVYGMSLTGIDVALSILEKFPNKTINLISRSGRLPQVKGKDLVPEKMLYFTYQNFALRGNYSLRAMYRLARKEFSSKNIDAYDYIFGKKAPDSSTTFKQRIDVAESSKNEFNTVLGMMIEMAKMWKHLSKRQLDLYHYKLHRRIHYIHGAMPLVRARSLLNFIDAGKIRLVQGKVEDRLTGNPVVNCTGHLNRINLDGNPLKAVSHYDSVTFKIQDDHYRELYGAGMVLCYSHPFMNNIEWLVMSSRELAKQFYGVRGQWML